MSKVLIIHSDRGTVKNVQIVEGDILSVLRKMVIEALNLWDPIKSDLIVFRYSHEIQVKLPLTKEQYEAYHRFNLRKVGKDTAAFDVPLYVISYENEMRGEKPVDYKVIIVAPYIDEKVSRELTELAKSITSELKEEEEISEEEE